MIDKITIRSLEIWTVLGVLQEERTRRRPVMVNLVMLCDTSKAIASDDIADTIDYSRIRDAVVEAVEKATFSLIESLASHIATLVLSFEGVIETTVTLDKPDAMEGCQSVAVEMTRKRASSPSAPPPPD